MKRFFVFCGILLGFTVLLLGVNEWINRYFLFAAQVAPTYKMHRLFYESGCEEIPVLGSSRAFVHVIPSELSPRVFNYGMDGSQINQVLFQLRYIVSIPSPHPVLVNIDPWGFPRNVPDPQSFVSEGYMLVSSHPYVAPAVTWNSIPPADRLPGIRFYGSLRQNFSAWREARALGGTRLDHGARLFYTRRSGKEWTFIQEKETAGRFSYSEEVWGPVLRDIYLHAKRPIVWLVAPAASYYRETYAGLEELHRFLREQAQHPNVAVFDAFTDSNYGYELFKDGTHLNVWGAQRYTYELRTFLSKRGFLSH